MSRPEPKIDLFLDAKGLSCPLPILRAKKAVATLAIGQVLKVETTDAGSKNDLPAWAKRTGNEIIGSKEGAGVYTFYIQKAA